MIWFEKQQQQKNQDKWTHSKRPVGHYFVHQHYYNESPTWEWGKKKQTKTIKRNKANKSPNLMENNLHI